VDLPMTLGWGIVGPGRIADDRMAPAINAYDGNRLVAVVSRDQARADAFAAKHNAAHALTSYAEMLQRSDIDVVLVTTPNALHAEQAIAAARAGKHVYCDKPLATNVADAERVVDACERAGVKLGLNFHNRYMPCFLETRRLVQSGEIGRVLAVQVETSAGPNPASTSAPWRSDPALAGHGTIESIGVHLYDVFRFILGAEVTRVSAFFDQPAGRLEKLALALFALDSGVLLQINTNETTPFAHNDFVIYGSKARITGRGLTRGRFGGELQVLNIDRETRTSYPSIDGHRAALSSFCQAILSDTEPNPSGLDGLRAVQITDAMARSAWEGVHVQLMYS
jgi:1,5-anhydro-D-fructose reductase (1,5-anhydro-D-mannitol-forming)